jgi:2-C-methyl-D-erythritol 4-phosphate cytidylyltransferase
VWSAAEATLLRNLQRLLRGSLLQWLWGVQAGVPVLIEVMYTLKSSTNTKMSRITAILPAAGLGTRMGAETPKQFLELDGVPILMLSLRRIASCELITDIIVATRGDGIARLEERIRAEKFKQSVRVLRGGDSRQESVARALEQVPDDTELVLVHDAVRPFVTREQITRVIEEARRCHAAILGIPAMDTVKEVKRASLPEDVALITATVPRERVVLAQTPQVFATKLLKEAFARATADEVNASDEAGLVERIGHDVHVVLGSERNIKITKPADMDLARFYMERERAKS